MDNDGGVDRRFGILISGKRRSGKDFVASYLTKKLEEKLGDGSVAQLRIAESLKRRFAEIHGADAERLMGTSSYKDQYRAKMIEWSENERRTSGDLTQFCRAACETASEVDKNSKIWIVCDCRRQFELEYFLLEQNEGRLKGKLSAGVFTIRVTASEGVRNQRGWNFIKGIFFYHFFFIFIFTDFPSPTPFQGADDIDSECGLDHWTKWDAIIENNGADEQNMFEKLDKIVDFIMQQIS